MQVIASEVVASDLLPRYAQTHVDDAWFNSKSAANDLQTLWSVSQVTAHWSLLSKLGQESSCSRRPYIKDGALIVPRHQWDEKRCVL